MFLVNLMASLLLWHALLLWQIMPCASQSYYEILNTTISASDDEIKKKYRKLALIFHPDKYKQSHAFNPSNDSSTNSSIPDDSEDDGTSMFLKIQQAYEVIFIAIFVID